MNRKILSVLAVLLILTTSNLTFAQLIDSSFIYPYPSVSDFHTADYPSDDSPSAADFPEGESTQTIAPGAECPINTAKNPEEWLPDEPYEMATDGKYLYIVGYDMNGLDKQWRIEKRDFKTGQLVQGFGPNGNGIIQVDPSVGDDVAFAITIDRNAMYVVGTDNSPHVTKGDWQWRIEKRDLVTGERIFGFGDNRDGIQISNPSSRNDEPHAIAIDTEFMYVAGFDMARGLENGQWRIEKRRLDNGSLAMNFGQNKDGVVTINPTTSMDVITALQVDQKAIYPVGFEGFNPGDAAQGLDSRWRIEKRDIQSGELVQGFGTFQDGIIISDPSKKTDMANDIAIDASFMYVVGFDLAPGSTGQWRIEKRSLLDGKFDPGFGMRGVQNSDPGDRDDFANAIAIDTEFMYVAGSEIPGGQIFSQWRIEKRRLKDGSFDPNFYQNGVLPFNPSKFNDVANDIVLTGRCFRTVGSDDFPAEQNPMKRTDLEWRLFGGVR